VRDRDVEVVLSDAFFADHLLLVRQMAQSGVRVRGFLGAFGLEFPAVIRELGPAAEGLLGTTTWQPGVFVPGDEAGSRAFTDAYRGRFGQEPIPLAMHGYAAIRALSAAIATALAGGQPPAHDALREALARVDVGTPLGRIRFDAQGDPLDYERVIVQIQGGRHVVVYPTTAATGRLVYPRP
jgi:branched-chain amino acid transport system substrate-binding protein